MLTTIQLLQRATESIKSAAAQAQATNAIAQTFAKSIKQQQAGKPPEIDELGRAVDSKVLKSNPIFKAGSLFGTTSKKDEDPVDWYKKNQDFGGLFNVGKKAKTARKVSKDTTRVPWSPARGSGPQPSPNNGQDLQEGAYPWSRQ